MKQLPPAFHSRKLVMNAIVFVTSAAVLLSTQSAQATSLTWTGATGGTWATGTNWSGSAPTSADSATILGPSNAAGVLNINIGAAANASTINFTDTSAVTLTNTASGSDQTLTVSGTGGITVGTGAVSIGSTTTGQGVDIALGASQTWNIGAGGLTANNAISGTGFSITKSGTGALYLNGANTYTGGMTVSNGTVDFGIASALPASGTVSVGSTGVIALSVGPSGFTSANIDSLWANTLTNVSMTGSSVVGIDTTNATGGTFTYATNQSTRSLTKLGTGTLVLSGANSYAGTTTISGGTLTTAGTNSSAGATTLNAGAPTLQLDNASNGGLASGTLTFGSSGSTIQSLLSGTALSNAISMTANFTVSGSNAITFNGNFTEAGSIIVTNSLTSGTLTLAGANLIISNANQLTLGGTANTTVSGVIQDNATPGGRLNKSGTDTLTLTNASSTYSGATTIVGGVLSVSALSNVGSASSLGAPTTVANGTIGIGTASTAATLLYTGTGSTTDRVINLAGTSGGTILTQSGTGNLDFTSSLTATGAGSKSLTLSGSTTGTGEIDGAIVDDSGTNKTSVIKSGTGLWTLSGANTYTGGTTVSGGTLVATSTTGSATGTGALTISGTSTMAGTGISSGSSFNIQGTNSTNRATILAGQVSTTDTNVASSLTLKGSGASTIGNTNLVFNLNAAAVGGSGQAGTLNVGTSGNELAVSTTAINFLNTVNLTLNLQNEPAIVGAYTPFVLVSGTGGGTTAATSQFTGLTFGASTGTYGTSGLTTVITGITGGSLGLAFGNLTDTSYYGTNSYIELYQNTGVDDIEVMVVPEPSTWALMFGGLLALVFWQRRNAQGKRY